MISRSGRATATRWPGGLLYVAAALLVSACGSSSPSAGPDAPSPTPIPTPVPAPAPVPAPSVVTRLVELTNAERAQAGLDTLGANTRLMQAAQIQADQLARVDRLDHVLPEAMYPRPEDRLAAAGYAWQTFGENLAFGYADAPRAVEGWMQSPEHRANILSANYTEIGTGYALNAAGRPYYVQVFGRPRS